MNYQISGVQGKEWGTQALHLHITEAAAVASVPGQVCNSGWGWEVLAGPHGQQLSVPEVK